MVDKIRVAVSINYSCNRYPKLSGFCHGNRLLLRIYNKYHAGKTLHILNTTKGLLKLYSFLFKLKGLFFSHKLKGTIFIHLLNRLQSVNTTLNSIEVCKHTAQPSMINKIHTGSFGFFLNRVSCLSLGTHKENILTFGSRIFYRLHGLIKHLYRLLKIDDIDTIPCAKDIGLHLRIPSVCLVSEVNSRLQKLFHCYWCHALSPVFWFFLRPDSSASNGPSCNHATRDPRLTLNQACELFTSKARYQETVEFASIIWTWHTLLLN